MMQPKSREIKNLVQSHTTRTQWNTNSNQSLILTDYLNSESRWNLPGYMFRLFELTHLMDNIGFQVEILICLLKITPTIVFMFYKGLSCHICSNIHPSFIHPSTYPPKCPPLFPPIHLFIHLSLHPSIHPIVLYLPGPIAGAGWPVWHIAFTLLPHSEWLPASSLPVQTHPALPCSSNSSSSLKSSLTTLIQMSSV